MSMYGFLYIVTGCDHMRVSFFPDTVRFEKSPCCFCQYSDPHMKYFFHLTTALSHDNFKKAVWKPYRVYAAPVVPAPRVFSSGLFSRFVWWRGLRFSLPF